MVELGFDNYSDKLTSYIASLHNYLHIQMYKDDQCCYYLDLQHGKCTSVLTLGLKKSLRKIRQWTNLQMFMEKMTPMKSSSINQQKRRRKFINLI